MKFDTAKRVLSLTRKKWETIFYLCLFCIVAFVIGDTLKFLQTEVLVREIMIEGVDYEEFRNLRLTEQQLNHAEEVITSISKRKQKLNDHIFLDNIGYLTYSMLAHDYNLINRNNISKTIFLQGISRIAKEDSFLELYQYYKAIFSDLKYFPIPTIENNEMDVIYANTWFAPRSYGGNRSHEGTDLMDPNNARGSIPIVSITDGVVEKIGWLEKGGKRIGIRSTSGGYFYYAHLDSYAPNLKTGDQVIAGQLLGFMGDSGYGPEGTVGQFDVHLHLGIYVDSKLGELSVNPYWILKILENKRILYAND